jgi:transcriptional antiterminator RfaH
MSKGQWFAVAAKPRQEQVGEVNLKRQGYQAFLPLIEPRKRRQNKWTMVTEPLFSDYLFLRLELGKDNLTPIRSTLGCSDLVRIVSGLVPVPDTVMTSLLSLSSSPKTSEILFSEGEEVAIAAGAFAGLKGIVKLAKGKERADVLLPCWARKGLSQSRWMIWFCNSCDLARCKLQIVC